MEAALRGKVEGGVEPGGRRIILRVAGCFVLWGVEGRVEACVEPCVETCVQHGLQGSVEAAGDAVAGTNCPRGSRRTRR